MPKLFETNVLLILLAGFFSLCSSGFGTVVYFGRLG
jgi:hypothetical protein